MGFIHTFQSQYSNMAVRMEQCVSRLSIFRLTEQSEVSVMCVWEWITGFADKIVRLIRE